MVTLLRGTSDLLEAAEEVWGSRRPFCLCHTCLWPWLGTRGPPTRFSLPHLLGAFSLPRPQDPQEVLLPSSSEPPGEALEEGGAV